MSSKARIGSIKKGVVVAPKLSKGGNIFTKPQRPDGMLPPKVRTFLEKRGGDVIKSLRLVRSPISGFAKKALDLLSLGKFDKALEKAGYDRAFHLALEINGEYTLDKREVITLVAGRPYGSAQSQVLDIPVSKPITFQQLFDNGRSKMGDHLFTSYNAKTNNCQDFLIGILDGSGLLTTDARDFIKQDAKEIFKSLPTYMDKVAKAVTDVAARVEEVVDGQGATKSQKWKDYYASEIKGKKFGSRAEVNAFMKECATKYKASKHAS